MIISGRLNSSTMAWRCSRNWETVRALPHPRYRMNQIMTEQYPTFTHDFSYRDTTSGLAESVAQLAAWFGELDQELRATIEGLSDEDIANRLIDRGGGFKLPPRYQLEVYKEALLIFYGKASV